MQYTQTDVRNYIFNMQKLTFGKDTMRSHELTSDIKGYSDEKVANSIRKLTGKRFM